MSEVNQVIAARPDAKLKVLLFWDLMDGAPAVDLDCSAVLFDQCGVLYDCAFYNNLNACAGAVVHSGDEHDGSKVGPDEEITVDLYNVPRNVYIIALIINAHHGGDLSTVETARVVFTEASLGDPRQVHAESVPCRTKDTGVIMGILVRVEGTADQFRFVRSGVTCTGRSFVESMPSIRKEVDKFVDPVLLSERTLSQDKTFNMHKGDIVEIPPDLFKGGADAFIGLGWSCKRSIDLDASVLAFNAEGQYVKRSNFSDKHGICGCDHMGDNLTGDGAGDDEVIMIDFDVIPQEIKELYFVVNVFSSSASFADVRDAYIRLVAVKTKRVLARFELSHDTVKTRGLVFLRVFRRPLSGWGMEAMGRGCGGNTCNDPECISACTILAPSLRLDGNRPTTPERPAVPGLEGPTGTLTVNVVSASSLPAMDLNGYSDPYVKMKCESSFSHTTSTSQQTSTRVMKHRTSVKKKNLAPTWNESYSFAVCKTSELNLTVWDKDQVTHDDRIGDIKLRIVDLVDWDTGTVRVQGTQQYTMLDKKGRVVIGKDNNQSLLVLSFAFQKDA